ncbi:MAG TPA: diguanylate cyclase [Gammaproteobacteria bacterium]
MPDHRPTSIKQFSFKYATIMFVVIFVVALLHYMAYGHHISQLRAEEHARTLQHVANDIGRTLDFYQTLADKMAAQPAIIDLLQFSHREKVQQWANRMQSLMPESIGFMLFDMNGRVLGVESELRLSEQCLLDVQRRFNNQPTGHPPVHYRIEKLAHYDIVSPVLLDGEKIGLLFVSFSLQTIKNLLNEFAMDNHRYRVTTSEGYDVAFNGQIDSGRGLQVYSQPVENSDWTIELAVINADNRGLLTSVFVTGLLTFTLISLVLYFSMKRISRVVISDFEILSRIMKNIREGEFDPDKVRNVSLKEARNVLGFIKNTARELNSYQQKLKHEGGTDELTGLANRRILNAEIEHYIENSRQFNNKYLVILDLDYFKQINDSYGHDVGDHVLKLLSEILMKHARKGDVCARSGGDEFILLLDDYTADQVNAWYKRISNDMLREVLRFNTENELDIRFGVSAGVTPIRGDDNKSTVLKRADEALYRVKAQGRGSIEFV